MFLKLIKVAIVMSLVLSFTNLMANEVKENINVVESEQSEIKDLRIASMHTMMIQPAPKEVSVMYFVIADNQTKSSIKKTVEYYLPKEAEGLELDPKLQVINFDAKPGVVRLTMDFQPGRNILPLRFLMPVSKGRIRMSFDYGQMIQTMQIMIPATTNATIIETTNIESVDERTIQNIPYRSYLVEDINSKNISDMNIDVQGLPKGRQPYWIYGLICLFVMSLFAVIMSRKSLKTTS